jgi:hypothetical protein
MPTFLADPSPTLYMVMAAAVFAAGMVLLNRRGRKTQLAFFSVLALVLVIVLCDFLVESPREIAVRKVQEFSRAINARDWDSFDAAVSSQFDYRGNKKADLRNRLGSVIHMFDARTAVWEFNRDKVSRPSDNQIEIVFDAKGDPKTGAAYYAHFKATFVKEPDGEWRLKTLAVYNYTSKTQGPEEELPGFQQK